MRHDRPSRSRLARLGLGLVVLGSLSACGEPEPPKKIDLETPIKVPQAPTTQSVSPTAPTK